MTRTAHSVWLVPGDQTRDRLSTCIDALARRSGAAVFEPHVTLLGDIPGNSARSRDACLQRIKPQGSVVATVTGLVQTNAYFMSLFLDLALDPDLTDLRSDLAKAVGLDHPGTYRPHISLAYGMAQGALDGPELDEIERAFLGTQVALTKAVIVASGQNIPIPDWHSLHEISLE